MEDVRVLLQHGGAKLRASLPPFKDLAGHGLDRLTPLTNREAVQRRKPIPALAGDRFALALRHEVPVLLERQPRVRERDVDDPALVTAAQPEEGIDAQVDEAAAPDGALDLAERSLDGSDVLGGRARQHHVEALRAEAEAGGIHVDEADVAIRKQGSGGAGLPRIGAGDGLEDRKSVV